METCASYDFDHPIYNELEFQIETPPMKLLHSQIQQCLWTGATGALIKGGSRMGKSTAIKALGDQLFTRSKKPVPVHRVTINKRDKPTIRGVFNALCRSANIHTSRLSTSDSLSDDFIHYMLDMVHDYEINRFVLMVDEMQRLKSWQFDAFAELYDTLRDPFGVALMVIFVANDPGCNALIEEMEDESLAHIRGRFFTQSKDFLGLTNVQSVEACLQQYDTLRFPIEVGPTYTECFLPIDFKKGWRFTMLSRSMWSVYRQYQKEYHIKSWPMKYFIGASNILLTDLLPHYGVSAFSEEMMHEAIKVSSLISSLVREK